MKPANQKLLAVIACIVALASCVKDDLSKCPPVDQANLTIYFSMRDDDNTDVFSRNIDNVDLIFFDSLYRYVKWITVDGSALSQLQGVRLYTQPGKYHIAAWGNMTGRTSVSQMSAQSRLGSSLVGFSTDVVADRLHYAPKYDWSATRGSSDEEEFERFVLNVPASGNHVHDLEFMCAYRQVKVWVKGLADMEGQDRPMPRYELTNITPGYDFMLYHRQESVNYTTASKDTDTPNGMMAYGYFNTPFFELDENIQIKIYNGSDGNLAYTLPLADFLWSQNKYPEPHELIEVFIEFMMDGTVKVGLVNWSWSGVDPM